jgi:hypothetical protein
MVAPLPFTLDHVLDAVVDACVQELTAAWREVAIVRAATAVERRDLEGKIVELERQLAERGTELSALRERLTAPSLPAPPRLATPEELAAPPLNPRLTGLSTLVGLIFGTWKVIERAGGAVGMSYWRCECVKCGARKDLPAIGAQGLRTRTPHCPSCRAKRAGRKPSPAAELDDENEEAPE